MTDSLFTSTQSR